MRRSNRLIIFFGAGVLLLVVLAIVLVFVRGGNPALLPAETPDGTVQRYLLAVQQKDVAAANRYVSPDLRLPNAPPTTAVQPGVSVPPYYQLSPFDYFGGNAWKAEIQSSTITGNFATVKVAFAISTNGGPFGSGSFANYIEYRLAQQSGVWIITSEAYSGP